MDAATLRKAEMQRPQLALSVPRARVGRRRPRDDDDDPGRGRKELGTARFHCGFGRRDSAKNSTIDWERVAGRNGEREVATAFLGGTLAGFKHGQRESLVMRAWFVVCHSRGMFSKGGEVGGYLFLGEEQMAALEFIPRLKRLI